MEFNRIIKLLRKERGITQKQAAEDLGVSQALLSHYEKGIRECGLDFVVRVADYYNVSCDYLLGRSAERNGMMLSAEDIPNPDKMKDNIYHGSVLPTMNKKLISNSLNVLYAKMHSAQANVEALLAGEALPGGEGVADPSCLAMTTESLTREYPLYTPSLLNLVKTSETRARELTGEDRT